MAEGASMTAAPGTSGTPVPPEVPEHPEHPTPRLQRIGLSATVRWVIIDELHALAENKRGTHL
ncbi:MAG: hypothetical protein EBU81_14595, partial [Proteobacteria bacterium]|nr:hypothetical protein [Pseudomonadota bacterium]